MSIYDSLNPDQREGVFTTEGPVLLLAGAGSGKTRVLTHRICYLIDEKNVDPYHILAITFTNKAAQEMRERVDRLIGSDAAMVWVSTFHSMCVKILRRYIDRIGFDNDFSIYDPDDCKTVIKNICKKQNVDTKTISEKSILHEISDCKNKDISPAEYDEMASDFREKVVAKVYRAYQKELQSNNALDFDDLLMKTVELFNKDAEVLSYYQRRFEYIHVDEYQDTNQVQFKLIAMLAGEKKNLCVVGDDDQSIYKFRGADITNILSFEKQFPGAKVIKLEQNYRSTPNILDVANGVIAHNKRRMDKKLWSNRPEGERVKLFIYADNRQEASGVIADLKGHVSKGEDYRDCAILYRTNAQSRSFEEECMLKNIPYKIVGGINFYQRAEIKDIIAYLKTISNGRDDVAVARIVNVPKRGIGDTSVDKAMIFAEANGYSLYDALKRADIIPDLSRAQSKIKGFVSQIETLRAMAETHTVDELISDIIDEVDYYSEFDKLDADQAETKKENILEFINKAVEYENNCENEGHPGTLSGFLEEVALIADIDSVEDDDNKVLLMTLHGAKGLEFPRVYLCGMEEELFPSGMSIGSDDPTAIEEERRLAYVGITRAKDKLTLTAARMRMIRGDMQFHALSRFVKEIPDGLLDVTKDSDNRRPGMGQTTGFGGYRGSGFSDYNPGGELKHRSFTDNSAKPAFSSRAGLYGTNPGFGKDISALPKQPAVIDYKPGDMAKHPKFGLVKIISMESNGKDYLVSIETQDGSVKKVMASFARMTKA